MKFINYIIFEARFKKNFYILYIIPRPIPCSDVTSYKAHRASHIHSKILKIVSFNSLSMGDAHEPQQYHQHKRKHRTY